MKLFHGSPIKNIENFNLESSKSESVEGSGIYFTDSYKLAKGYAGSNGSVYVCMFNSQAIFDGTNKDEFLLLLRMLSKKINIDLLKLPYLDETIEGLTSGSYQISDDQGKGLIWQISNLLGEMDTFNNLSNQKEVLSQIKSYITEYMKSHYILKYYDSHLGLIYLCKDPAIIKILKEIDVGSDDEIAYL